MANNEIKHPYLVTYPDDPCVDDDKWSAMVFLTKEGALKRSLEDKGVRLHWFITGMKEDDSVWFNSGCYFSNGVFVTLDMQNE